MKKRTPDKFWFPWWPDKWIFGSIRIECTVEERAIWVDLLSLASKDNGYIRANEETPYPTEQLAGMLMVPQETLANAIEKFINLKDKDGKGKLTRTKYGTLYVTKWEKYQFSDRWKRKLKEGSSEKTEQCSSESAPIINNNKKNNNKENNKDKVEEEFEKHLWKPWPEEGRFKKKYCLMKFRALIKAGKKEEFLKTTRKYATYIQMKWERDNFKQQVMHLSTWLNNWEDEKEQYMNFKYEPPL